MNDTPEQSDMQRKQAMMGSQQRKDVFANRPAPTGRFR